MSFIKRVYKVLWVRSQSLSLFWFNGIPTIVGYLMPNPFLYISTVLFQTIQFSVTTLFSSINPKIVPYQVLALRARVDLGAIALKRYSAFPNAPALRSDCLVSYPGHQLGGSYPSAEMQSVFSAAPAELAKVASHVRFDIRFIEGMLYLFLFYFHFCFVFDYIVRCNLNGV